MENNDKTQMVVIIGIPLLLISGIFFMIIFLSSCTLSFQNISTHGVATDLVDENQTATPSTDITASIPKL